MLEESGGSGGWAKRNDQSGWLQWLLDSLVRSFLPTWFYSLDLFGMVQSLPLSQYQSISCPGGGATVAIIFLLLLVVMGVWTLKSGMIWVCHGLPSISLGSLGEKQIKAVYSWWFLVRSWDVMDLLAAHYCKWRRVWDLDTRSNPLQLPFTSIHLRVIAQCTYLQKDSCICCILFWLILYNYNYMILYVHFFCSLNTFIVVRSCSSMLSTSKVTLITLSVQTFIVRRGMFCIVSWGCWLLLDATAWEDDSSVCGGRGSKQSRLQSRLSWTIAPLKLQTKQSRHQHLFAPFRMFLPAGRCCKEDARMRSSIPEMQALEFRIPELSWLEAAAIVAIVASWNHHVAAACGC